MGIDGVKKRSRKKAVAKKAPVRRRAGTGSSALVYAAMIVVALLVLWFFLGRKEALPSPENPAYLDTSLSVPERVDDLLHYMTLEEKIGQMALVENNSINASDVGRYGIGAILSGGGGKPETNTPEGWRRMVAGYMDASKESRLGIPILYGVDANHGQGNVPGATIFPHMIGLGATDNPELVEAVAGVVREETLALGIRWSFSPTLDLPEDNRWGRVYETLSDDPARAASLGSAYVRGLQGASVINSGSVLATAKHFVGAGGMQWGTSSNKDFSIDQGTTPPDEKKLREKYLPPFKAAIDEGAMSVMVGLNSWGDEKISASRYLVTDVLKGELGFEGFVVSDWYGVYEITDDDYRSAVIAINAGVDMVMLPFDYQDFVDNVSKAVHRGEIPEARIDDAVRRILTAKFALGIFEDSAQPDIDSIGSERDRELARVAVQESMVLLKNEGALPISRSTASIRVAGSAADNIGMQSGAWTVEWQGIDGNWLPGATSILAGIRSAAEARDIDVSYDRDGAFAEGHAQIGIAIVGEKPYAEGWGDNADPGLSDVDLLAIERLRASCDRLIVVIVSGRPLDITDKVANWDALVAAWLPGSEGAGVADVLFGDAPFTGTLPIAWPLQ